MSYHVRREAAEDSSFLAVAAQQFPEGLAHHCAAAVGHEQVRARSSFEQLRAAGSEIVFHGLERGLSDRYQPVLVAFANHAHIAHIFFDVGDSDAAEFGNSEAGGVEEFEHGAIAEALRSG